MGWVTVAIEALIAIIKGFFGMDHPERFEVKNEKPSIPVGPAPSVLVDELRALRGTTGKDELHSSAPREASTDSGKQDGAGDAVGRNPAS